jgi:hypothetical protein
LNACIALLNQTGIAQKEAPCFALTIGSGSSDDSAMQVDGESNCRIETLDMTKCEALFEIVANKATGAIVYLQTHVISPDLSFDPSLALLDRHVEQVLAQLGEQITEVTFSE